MSSLERHQFDEKILADLQEAFDIWNRVDQDKRLDTRELAKALQSVGSFNQWNLNDIMQKADINGDGTIDFDEFITACWENKDCLMGFVADQWEMIRVKRDAIQSIVHTFAQEEMNAFAEHMNFVLGHDKDLAYLMPIKAEGLDLCHKISDGCLLAKYINIAVPGTIDYRAINQPRKKNNFRLNLFQINENNNLVVNSAKSIGVVTVNIGAADLRDGSGKPHLVLGIFWQLVKIQLLSDINLNKYPQLIRLLCKDETLTDLLALPAELLLLRWFNYHLKEANHPRKVNNFGLDVFDSECYTILLNRLSPKKCSKEALEEKEDIKRAEMVVRNAGKLGAKWAKVFIKPCDIVSANEHLNLAFTASVFNHCPGLAPVTWEEEKQLICMMEDDVGDSREERVFRMWINTLGIDDLYINNLFEDCRDGLVLLKVLDKIEPGLVCWGKVEKNPTNKFKKVSNNNYVGVLSKSLKFSLVTTGGVDIVNANKKLVLGLVWQLRRYHSIKLLNQLRTSKGKKVSDKDILCFCNKMAIASGMGCMKIRSFGDKRHLKNGQFFICVLGGVFPKGIDWDLMTKGANDEDAILNARYSLSIAREEDCTIFLLPEDIIEANPRMCLTFGAAIMAHHHKLEDKI